MSLSRRNQSFRQRLANLFWPRMSFARTLRYFGKKILRIRATPHAIAIGFAVGVFSAFSPFLGFHILMAAGLAYLLSGNIVASALGTVFANPLTLPLIWGSTYEVGRQILANGPDQGLSAIHLGEVFGRMELAELWNPLLKPMLVGSVPLGLAFGALAYVITRLATTAFQARRRERMLLKASRLRPSALPGSAG